MYVWCPNFQKMYILFQGMYTILYIQCVQFFYVYFLLLFIESVRFVHSKSKLLKNQNNFIYSTYTIFQYIQFCIFNIHIFFKECSKFYTFNAHNFSNNVKNQIYSMYIIYILNVHNFSHNVHNSIYSNKYNFSKNFHNSVYLMYKFFPRIYIILHIQHTQFFKEYSIYLIMYIRCT